MCPVFCFDVNCIPVSEAVKIEFLLIAIDIDDDMYAAVMLHPRYFTLSLGSTVLTYTRSNSGKQIAVLRVKEN